MSHVDWERVRRNSLASWSNGLTDRQDEAATALRSFGRNAKTGIVSEPLIRSWMPQRLAEPSWRSPIPWLPNGYWPYEFQAKAFDRLSVANQLPRPTAIAAPEGSGKSECFLLPILDHCARQQGMSRSGVKAVIIYASRAAAADNAARMGALCSTVEKFHDLRPALLIDEFGSSDRIGPSFIIDSIDAMSANPPDLLLTVPEMLERSINTKRHHGLWAETTPVSLRFVVVDDLHFYTDTGIQDLAVLLRRLGTSLGMASPTQPLGGAVPVVTAGIKLDPLDQPAPPTSSPNAPPVGAPNSSSQPPGSTLPPPVAPRSVLPKPTVDTGGGAAALPDLSTAPAEGPRPTGAFARPTAGSLPPIGSLSGADTDDDGSESNDLLDLATFLFGVKFKADALIVDSTMSPDELCGQLNSSHKSVTFDELARYSTAESGSILQVLFGPISEIPQDPVSIGQLLCTHPLVHKLLVASHEGPVAANTLDGELGGAESQTAQGVQRLASVLAESRRMVGSFPTPLLRVDAQLVLRPLERVVREVALTPSFASANSVALEYPQIILPPRLEDGAVESRSAGHTYLPAVACRNCGSSGWLGALLGHNRQKLSVPSHIWEPLGDQGGRLAIVMVTLGVEAGSDDTSRLLDPSSLDLIRPDESGFDQRGLIPIAYTSGATAVSGRTCPVCEQRGVVNLIGSTTSELTADITTDLLTESQGQDYVIGITNSAASVSQQIETIVDDSYADEIRGRIIGALSQATGPTQVMDLVDSVIGQQAIIPNDLHEGQFVATGSGALPPEQMEVLRGRVEFDLLREFGRGSAESLSLSSNGLVDVRVETGELAEVIAEIQAKVLHETDLSVDRSSVEAYLHGMLDKLRLDGAMRTRLLDKFINEGGDPAFVTTSRPAGLPELTGPQRPRFLTTAAHGGFTSVTAIHQRAGGPRTWLVDWACETLGINAVDAPTINQAALEALAGSGETVFAVDSFDGHRVYGLEAAAISVSVTASAAGSTGRQEATQVAVRAVSVVDASPIEKAQAEWMFRYGQEGEAPNVLYMSAGHLRSDRDVVDTTIDLAVISSIVVDSAAVRELGSIPEVRRVGISSGMGTVVILEPERSLSGLPVVSREDSTEALSVSESTMDKGIETGAELPSVPEHVRVSQDDYFDYLFDRVTSGLMHFSAGYQTLAEFMSVAETLPERVPDAPSSVGGASAPSPSLSAEGQDHGAHEPGLSANIVNVAGVNVPTIDMSFTPIDLGTAEKPLFQAVGEASEASTSMTKPTPLDDYLRTIAPDHSEKDRVELKEFAKEGARTRLDVILQSWKSRTATTADGAGPSPDRLESMPWHDGLSALMSSAGTVPDQHVGDNLGKVEASSVSGPTNEANPSRSWAIRDGFFGVEYWDPPVPAIRLTLPILDIQGQARLDSFAAALLSGLDALSHPVTELSVVSEWSDVADGGIQRASILITPVGDESVLAYKSISDLSDPNAMFAVLEAVRRVVDDCACGDTAQSACESCLLRYLPLVGGSVAPQGKTHGQAGTERARADLLVSRCLAVETLELIIAQWADIAPAKDLATTASARLGSLEMGRAFELALKSWIDREPDLEGSFGWDAGDKGSLRLTMVFDDLASSYRLVPRNTVNATITDTGSADYLVTQTDGEWPEFDVYFDLQLPSRPSSHRNEENPTHEEMLTLIADSHKAGKLGWALTWQDIREFYLASVAAEAADVSNRELVPDEVRLRAIELLGATDSSMRVDSLEQNPLALMLDIMARPRRAEWATVFGALDDAAQSVDRPEADPSVPSSRKDLIWAVLSGLAQGNPA